MIASPVIRSALRGRVTDVIIPASILVLLLLLAYGHHHYLPRLTLMQRPLMAVSSSAAPTWAASDTGSSSSPPPPPPPLPLPPPPSPTHAPADNAHSLQTADGSLFSRPGIPKPVAEYTKALVIARLSSEDISWVDEEYLAPQAEDELDPARQTRTQSQKKQRTTTIRKEWRVYAYTTDDQQAEYHTPLNKGREATAYLSYIIEHYSALPDLTLFTHAHRLSWHDDGGLPDGGRGNPHLLRRLNLTRLSSRGYLNLRCAWSPGCPSWMQPILSAPPHTSPLDRHHDPSKPEQSVFAPAWRALFPLDPVPAVLAQPCCSQFGVTRERIRAREMGLYVQMRQWLLATDLEDGLSGRVFEYLWQVLWTGEPVVCPDEGECLCGQYGVCGDGAR